jgi:hypothetical protein
VLIPCGSIQFRVPLAVQANVVGRDEDLREVLVQVLGLR